eukprot:TRINITY_DN21849_c0_g1_i1.p1 TRINITY_DN21849_c0_g1~~TRINITY_DN21849_c0_g1_i1.p1  ORF type:complete len:348 (+),score=139.18 TRINITY_DN21849_c0_g1_i1:104-1147(+)
MPQVDTTSGLGSPGRSSPRGATSDDEGVGMGTQGLNKAGLNWNQMHEKYRDAVLAEWQRKKGPFIKHIEPVVRWSPELMRRERDMRRQRLEDRMEREEKKRDEEARVRREFNKGLAEERARLEYLRVQGILERREHNRWLRDRAVRAQEEEATAEALRARERKDREREMREREFKSIEDVEHTAHRLEKAEQEASRKRLLAKLDESKQQRRDAAQKERERRKHRETAAKQDSVSRLRVRTEEIRTEHTKRAQETDKLREDRREKVASRLRELRHTFNSEAEQIFASRNKRQEEQKRSVSQRRAEREWARVHSESRVKKYIVFTSQSRSPSPLGQVAPPSAQQALGAH